MLNLGTNDDDANLVFGLLSEQQSLVADLASTTDKAFIKIYANGDTQSNVGYRLGTSNINASTAMFFIADGDNNASNALVVREGKVGINTVAPSQTLDVRGSIYLSGDLHFNSNGSMQYLSPSNIALKGDLRDASNALLQAISNNTGASNTIMSYINANIATKSELTNASNALLLAISNNIVDLANTSNIGTSLGTTNLTLGTSSNYTNILGNAIVSGNLTASNLTVLGTTTILNSVITENSNLVINNEHLSGKALIVNQLNGNNEEVIADFFDKTYNQDVPVFRVGESGRVGINTSNLTQALNVNGSIYLSGDFKYTYANGPQTLSPSNIATKGHVNAASNEIINYVNTKTFTVDLTTASNIGTASSTPYIDLGHAGATTTVQGAFSNVGIATFDSNLIVNGTMLAMKDVSVAGTLYAKKLRLGHTLTTTTIPGTLNTGNNVISGNLTVCSNVIVNSNLSANSIDTKSLRIGGFEFRVDDINSNNLNIWFNNCNVFRIINE